MTATPHQLAEMLEYCVDFAKQMIENSGEFHPFGVEIGQLGGLQALAFWDGRENPPGQELYAYAQSVMAQKSQKGEILGGAIAANVNIPPEYQSGFSDGIRVHIESQDYSRLIYLPYAIPRARWFGRRKPIKYGEMFAVEMEPAFFSRAKG